MQIVYVVRIIFLANYFNKFIKKYKINVIF